MKIIITGGTLCKKYDPKTQELVLSDCEMTNLLSGFYLNSCPEVLVWDRIDSRHMDENHRQSLYSFCLDKDERLVVVHGTDTMELSAEYFRQQNPTGTIVFTGSWVPLVFEHSDAEFNLGFAIACAKYQPPGVYIAMGGECLSGAKKNWDSLRFEN